MRSTPLPSPTSLLAAALVAGTLVVSSEAAAAVALSKTRARAAASQVARQTCGMTSWCRGVMVEPARACRRSSSRRVVCEIRFRDGDGEWAAGLVDVRRRGGRLQVGAAVPSEPGASTGTPTVVTAR